MIRTSLLAALAVSLAFAPPLHAQTKTPSGMPAYGQEKSIPAPKIAKQTLANGLTVWVVPRQGLPRVDFVLALRGAGFAADAVLAASIMAAGLRSITVRLVGTR